MTQRAAVQSFSGQPKDQVRPSAQPCVQRYHVATLSGSTAINAIARLSCCAITSRRARNENPREDIMSRSSAKVRVYPLLVALFALAACGGGGSELVTAAPPPPAAAASAPVNLVCTPPPEGAQSPAAGPFAVGGVIARQSDPSFVLLGVRGVFDDDRQVMVYGPDLATSSVMTGFVTAGAGYGCSSADLTAYNGRDYGRSAELVYLRTTVGTAPPSVAGSLRNAGATYTLSGGALPGADPAYSFLHPADLDAVAGSWTLADAENHVISLVIDAGGRLSGTYGGCAFDGQVEVDAMGSGRLGLRLMPRPCLGIGEPYVGALLAYPLAAGGQQMVFWAESSNGFDYIALAAVGRR
jgi:hypothetical protein